jgi:hypothetical protein
MIPIKNNVRTVSYIIPVCRFTNTDYIDRIESINFALAHFITTQNNVLVETIIVEQTLDGKAYYSDKIVCPPGKDIKIISVQHPTFNKGWICNIGVNAASHDDIVIAESDMYVADNSYFLKLFTFVETLNIPWCIGWRTLLYSTAEAKKLILSGGSPTAPMQTVHARHGGAEGGLVYFKRPFYKSIGGMNEWMEGLGGMDNDLAFRAHYVSEQYQALRATVVHLHHADSPMKSHPTRQVNQRIYRTICARPQQAVAFMRSKPIGGTKPLCSTSQFPSMSHIPAELSRQTAMQKKARIAQLQAQRKK